MKRILLFILLGLLPCMAAAQTAGSFIIALPDTTVLTGVTQNLDGSLTPVFSIAGINSIVSGYSFTQFAQAYPTSRYPYLRQVYKATVNDTAAGAALAAAFPAIFPGYAVSCPGGSLTFTPHDWEGGLNPGYVYTWYLDYIHARQAWDYSHGDTSVVIGVTDSYFDTTNPDWVRRIARVEHPFARAGDNHGTVVAGHIACNTDNYFLSGSDTIGIGYPAIGFNCRLDLSTKDKDDNELLVLSGVNGRKILNGSWYSHYATPTLDLTSFDYSIAQGVYDEIYENGTIACFAAGNGQGTSGDPCSPAYFLYPASFDHNISVTNIMGENCPWAGSTCHDTCMYCSISCACDVHDYSGHDSTQTTQHNTRVDICAPGLRTGGLDYFVDSPTTSPLHYYSHENHGGGGTSYAAPLVSGTLGLMLSENPCLSPYQLEYCLKKGARTGIYDTPANAYLAFPPRLGVGALDADSAVYFANPNPRIGNFSCNDPATQTFFILGVELNTICSPSPYGASNGAKPKLVPILQNGTPPYTYQWTALIDNHTTIDSPQSATPTIISANAPYLAYYRLTVYDASPVQKVADRIIRIQLDTSRTYKLAMRDSYVDMLDQPNTQGATDPREATNFFSSPDIWCRHLEDGDRTPENPAYTSLNDTNYMYVRVRNVGCANYDSAKLARLRTYWTLASTGEAWAHEWTTDTVLCDTSGSHGFSYIPVGKQITHDSIIIPFMQPGDSFVVAMPWQAVNPGLYIPGLTSVDVCGLARIEDPTLPDSGMAFPEVAHVGTNIINNNHVVSRNMVLVPLSRSIPPVHAVYVGNTELTTAVFSLRLATDRDVYRQFAGNLSEFMTVKVTLDTGLFNLWATGGYLGTYTALDPLNRTVTYDPATPLRLDNIAMPPGAKYPVLLSFNLNSTPVGMTITNHTINFQQLGPQIGNTTDQQYGCVSYAITIPQDSGVSASRRAPATQPAPVKPSGSQYNVYPNPASDIVYVSFTGQKGVIANITLSDMTGRLLMKQAGVSIQNGAPASFNFAGITPGMYLVSIQDESGCKQTFKITKTN